MQGRDGSPKLLGRRDWVRFAKRVSSPIGFVRAKSPLQIGFVRAKAHSSGVLKGSASRLFWNDRHNRDNLGPFRKIDGSANWVRSRDFRFGTMLDGGSANSPPTRRPPQPVSQLAPGVPRKFTTSSPAVNPDLGASSRRERPGRGFRSHAPASNLRVANAGVPAVGQIVML